MLTLFWHERGVIMEHYMPRREMVTSAEYADLLQGLLRSSQNDVNSLSRVSCCKMAMLKSTLPVQQLKPSQICHLSVFNIRRTCQISPPVIFTSSDHSKM